MLIVVSQRLASLPLLFFLGATSLYFTFSTDDPLLLNVTFTYNGPTVHQDTGIKTFSPFTLGTSAILLGVDDWTSRDHSLTPDGNTFVLAVPHTDQILVPVPDAASTLGLFGFGLLALQQLRRRLAK